MGEGLRSTGRWRTLVELAKAVRAHGGRNGAHREGPKDGRGADAGEVRRRKDRRGSGGAQVEITGARGHADPARPRVAATVAAAGAFPHGATAACGKQRRQGQSGEEQGCQNPAGQNPPKM